MEPSAIQLSLLETLQTQETSIICIYMCDCTLKRNEYSCVCDVCQQCTYCVIMCVCVCVCVHFVYQYAELQI